MRSRLVLPLCFVAMACIACDEATPLPKGTCEIDVIAGGRYWASQGANVTVRRFAELSTIKSWPLHHLDQTVDTVPTNTRSVSQKTDIAGQTTFSELPTGVYVVRVEAGVHPHQGAYERVVVLPVRGYRAEVAAPIDSADPSEGRVRWDDRSPIAGTLSILPERNRADRSSDRLQGLPLSPGKSVRLSEDGVFHVSHVQTARDEVRILFDDGLRYTNTRPIRGRDNVIRRPTKVLRGRIVSTDGKPIEGARVQLRFPVNFGGTLDREVTTSADGTFESLANAGTRVIATASGYLADATNWDRGELTLALRPFAHRMSGTVRQADGTVAPGARLVITDTDLREKATTRYLSADVHGAFSFTCSGPVRVVVCGGGWVTPNLSVPPKTGQWMHFRDKDITLRAVPCARVRGRVVDRNGKPLPGIGVKIAARRPPEFKPRWFQTSPSTLWEPAMRATDAAGEFEFGSMDATLTYDVHVRGAGLASTSQRVPPNHTGILTIVASRPNKLDVRVRSGRLGRPSSNAVISLAEPVVHGFPRNARVVHADAKGIARFRNLRPGPYSVTVTGNQMIRITQSIARGGVNEPFHVDLRAFRSMFIKGRIVKATGFPTPPFEVTAILQHPTDRHVVRVKVVAGVHFRIEGLRRGTYQLRFEGTPKERYQAAEVTAKAGARKVEIPVSKTSRSTKSK